MAYVPPHKRHSKDPPKPTPVPSSVIARFKQTLSQGGGSKSSSRRRQDRHQSNSNQEDKIIYATNSICRWFAAGFAGDDPVPSSVRLEPLDTEFFQGWKGPTPPVLRGGEGGEIEESPWVKIAERVVPDLIHCYQTAIEGLESEREAIKLSVDARVGKVLFLGNSSGLESIRKAADAETDSRKQVNKVFYTNVSSAYMEDIQNLLVPKIGFDFKSEKEYYVVQIFDKTRPDSTMLCKCIVANDGAMLGIDKIELKPVRHLVVDISCPYKDLDLRLMLYAKRIIKSLDDEENEAINQLVKSAVIDSDMKGGLRWPLGTEPVADRFSVVGFMCTKYKSFKSQTTKIKLGHLDLIGHRTSDVTLKLTGISKHLRDGNVEHGLIEEMVQGAVKLIWDHFLSYNYPST